MVRKIKTITARAVYFGIQAIKTVFQMQNGCCRFSPSCSEYAREAVEKKPLPAALFLICKRVLRCHPFFPGGYDPVPEHSYERVKSE